MIKICILAYSFFPLFVFASNENVNFTGRIINETCSTSSETPKYVSLPNVSSDDFIPPMQGMLAGATTFALTFDCPNMPDGYQPSISLSASHISVGSDECIKNTANENPSDGVCLSIYNNTLDLKKQGATIVSLDGVPYIGKIGQNEIKDGMVSYEFTVEYEQINSGRQPTPGFVSGAVTYDLEYP